MFAVAAVKPVPLPTRIWSLDRLVAETCPETAVRAPEREPTYKLDVVAFLVNKLAM